MPIYNYKIYDENGVCIYQTTNEERIPIWKRKGYKVVKELITYKNFNI